MNPHDPMSPHDDRSADEQKIAAALHSRADHVEPSANSYAVLAEKVAAANERPTAWWRTPNLMWVGAVGSVAALLLVIGIVATGGDDGGDSPIADEAITATETPQDETPTPTAEPDPDPEPTPVPRVGTFPETIWPIGALDADAPTSGPEAVVAFYDQLLGIADVPLGALDAPDPSFEQYLVFTRDDDGAVIGGANGDEVANFAVREVDGSWVVFAIDSPAVVIEESTARSQTLADLSVDAFGRGFEALISLDVFDADNNLIAQGFGMGGGGAEPEPFTAAIGTVLDPDYTGPAIAVLYDNPVADNAVPGVAAMAIEIVAGDGSAPEPVTDPTPVEDPGPIAAPDLPNGAPVGIIHPSAAFAPFGEWSSTPEDAAFVFLDQMIPWPFELGDVTYSGDFDQFATVQAFGIDEDGQRTAAFTTIELAGGSAFESAPNWGVLGASDPEIVSTGVVNAGDPDRYVLTPLGEAVAFEGNVGYDVVSSNGEILASGSVMGGGTELLPMSGSIDLGATVEPGPAYIVYSDIGGRGIPVSVTVLFVDLPAFEASGIDDPGVSDTCSADGRSFNGEQEGLPEAVQGTRNSIIAAAVACDYEALAAILGDGNFSFGGGTDAAEFWRQAEAAGESPMWFLVEMLEQQWIEDTGTASATTLFFWPEAFIIPIADLSPDDRAYYEGVYGEDVVDGWEAFGGYTGYRIGIDSDGNWLSFVIGD